MPLELLILIICANNQGGCSESMGAYYESNKDLQNWVNKEQRQAEDIVGKERLATFATVSGIILIRTGTVNINSFATATVGLEKNVLNLHWEF